MLDKFNRVGLLGYGTVGKSLSEILQEKEVQILRVGVRDVAKHQANPGGLGESRFTDELDSVVESPGASLIFETMGGLEPAFALVKRSLQLNKPVVTANKMLIATYFEMLGNHPLVKYEAAVGAAIPIVGTLKELVAYDEVIEIEAILNGTTNFMLTQMSQGLDYESALALAQEKGYAEADPSSDVEGLDASYKIAILGSLASNKTILPGQFSVKGITSITPDEVLRAKANQRVFKLIASYKDGECTVEPREIPINEPLAQVNNELNAVSVKMKNAGTLFFQGPGAGGVQTASAMLKDYALFQSKAGK